MNHRRFSFLSIIACHPLAWLGTFLVTFGAIFAFAYTAYSLVSGEENQYIGLLFLFVVPPAFFGGLALIPVGVYLRLRRWRKDNPSVVDRPLGSLLKEISGVTDRKGIFYPIFFLTVVNVVITAVILGSGYHYTESTTFCGTVCHTVMEPEHTAYLRSPHSRIPCVQCHIGPGASWFVRAKLSGLRQVWAVFAGTYSRPIPVPIEHLRPSRETCENCHWPEKFHGEKLKVIEHFDIDRNNTKLYTVLLLKIGGPNTVPGKASGVHWHISEGNQVTYVSEKNQRNRIPWVRYERDGSEPVEYFQATSEMSLEEIAGAEKRVMECIDCHNRPTHIYEVPDEAMDDLIRKNPQLQSIPFLKKKGLEILKTKFSEEEIEDRAVEARLLAWYEDQPWTEKEVKPPLLAQAADEVQSIYRRNVWPRMNIGWKTYPNHLSHIHFPGCLRCHENTHRTKTGKSINADCRLCHTIFAIREKNPPILKLLLKGTRSQY